MNSDDDFWVTSEGGYWELVQPIWDTVNIYSGGDVFLRAFSAVPRESGHLLAAHWCWSEVCNGGLRQLFSNSTGVLAPEAVDGFRAIGMPMLADTVAEAMALLPTPYERERARRREFVDCLPDAAYERIAKPSGDLNEKFFGLARSEAGGFETAADDYARRVSLHSGE